MIPKIIHYCWFGGKPKPLLAEKCIESWKKYLPDYEIIEWNEENFDINSNDYCKEAYESKKWAFITDYVRVKVLYEFGGIYMDTDVEVLKSLDVFLSLKAFSGFESKDRIPTGIMASEKNLPLFSKLMHDYDDRHFIKENGELDLTTNVTTITNYLLEDGLVLNNKKQTVSDFTLFPNDYFCPKDCVTRKIHLTNNSYVIHHFDGSWQPKKKKLKYELINRLNPKLIEKLVTIKNSFK